MGSHITPASLIAAPTGIFSSTALLQAFPFAPVLILASTAPRPPRIYPRLNKGQTAPPARLPSVSRMPNRSSRTVRTSHCRTWAVPTRTPSIGACHSSMAAMYSLLLSCKTLPLDRDLTGRTRSDLLGRVLYDDT